MFDYLKVVRVIIIHLYIPKQEYIRLCAQMILLMFKSEYLDKQI